jgi:hypothetical protein
VEVTDVQRSIDVNGEPGLARLDSAEAAQWRDRLAATEHPCGCKSGALATLAALVGWPIWVVASGPPTAPLTVAKALATYTAVVIGAALVGKLAGIAAGRAHYRRLRRRLAHRLVAAGAAREA